jgi:hypothetical protein
MDRDAYIILTKILEGQYQLYKSELEIINKKIGFVEKDMINELAAEIEKEKEIVQKIDTLEQNRIKVVEKLGYKTLKELAENEKIPQIKESLLKLREALINVLEEVKEKNELLQDLVLTTNGIIEKTLGMITGSKEVGYKKDKQKNKINDNNLLNTRI